MVNSKKNAGRFKKGRQPYIKKGETTDRWTNSDSNQVPTVRLPKDLHDQVMDAPISSPVNLTDSHRMLRPLPVAKHASSR